MTLRRLRGLALPAVCLASLVAVQGCSMGQSARSGSPGNVASGTARLEVQNDSGQMIRSVQVSSCSDAVWGPNRLGDGAILAGGQMSFDLTPGCWDFRADFDGEHASGNELVQRNIQLDSGSSWTWNIATDG